MYICTYYSKLYFALKNNKNNSFINHFVPKKGKRKIAKSVEDALIS